MIEVLAQTFSSPADTAVWAVVDFLLAVVVPQLADVTVIACSLRLTVLACIGCLLRRTAYHTEHVLCHLPVQVMALDCIVTVSTSIPATTLEALHLDVALVVLAAKHELPLGDVILFVFAMLCTVVVMWLRSVRWVGVALSQVVRGVGIDVGG